MENEIVDYKSAIEMIRNGDQKLLEKLITQFSPLFKKYSYLVNDEDAYSEFVLVFIEIIHNINFDRFDDECFDYIFLAYITRVIQNKYIFLSKKKQFSENEILPIEKAYETAVVETGFEDVSFFEIIKTLNKQQAEIITLIYFWGYSAAEVARKKNMSRQAVNQHKQRALNILRRNLMKGY